MPRSLGVRLAEPHSEEEGRRGDRREETKRGIVWQAGWLAAGKDRRQRRVCLCLFGAALFLSELIVWSGGFEIDRSEGQVLKKTKK